MAWLSRTRSPKLPPARPPAEVTGQVPSGWKVLAALPYADDGLHWLLACRQGLVCTGQDAPLPARTGWDLVSHAAWDADERALTIDLLETDPVTLRVPPLLRRTEADGTSQAFEVRDKEFAPALRQQVEAAIIHYVRRTLATGERVTVSARRRGDGEIYVAVQGDRGPVSQAGQEELDGVARQMRLDVGLPTR